MRSASGGGPRSRPARSGSSRTRTSARASAWNRWPSDSPRGRAATPTTPTAGPPPRGPRSADVPSGSRRTCAALPAFGRTRSVGWPGPVTRCARREPGMMADVIGYFFGDDGYGLEREADRMLEQLRASGDVERWRVSGDATSATRIAERIGTASMFGGGTLAIVSDPAPLVRTRDDRDALIATLGLVAPGNGLVFLEPNDGSGRRPAALVAVAKAVQEAGGAAREVKAPREGQLAGWIDQRARERNVRLGPGA